MMLNATVRYAIVFGFCPIPKAIRIKTKGIKSWAKRYPNSVKPVATQSDRTKKVEIMASQQEIIRADFFAPNTKITAGEVNHIAILYKEGITYGHEVLK